MYLFLLSISNWISILNEALPGTSFYKVNKVRNLFLGMFTCFANWILVLHAVGGLEEETSKMATKLIELSLVV